MEFREVGYQKEQSSAHSKEIIPGSIFESQEGKQASMTKPSTLVEVEGQKRRTCIVKFRKNITKGKSRANEIPNNQI